MSFDNLMQHAYEIQQQATLKALTDSGARPAALAGEPQLAPWQGEQETRQRVEQMFGDIPELFQAFAEMPDPAAFDGRLNELRRSIEELSSGSVSEDPISGNIYPANPRLDEMLDAESHIESWTGRAAMEFKSNFISPFPSIVHNQFMGIAVLRAALDAEREIWVRARDDIDKIAHDTITALDRMDDCGKNEWVMTFTVVSSVAAVAGVALAPVSFGLSLGLTAVGASSQVAAAGVPDDPPAVRFQGETAQAVVDSMRDAIRLLHGYIAEQEQKIADALTSCCQAVAQQRNSFVAKRPALADATQSNVTGPLFMGYST
ncbi:MULTISPECIES: hypothetical protein [unclassified Micromonospora]|uniref:hypothetical protein n=1 Tax=unclassified Micromonospora TaxID=2617518 RepID=UPI003A8B24B0